MADSCRRPEGRKAFCYRVKNTANGSLYSAHWWGVGKEKRRAPALPTIFTDDVLRLQHNVVGPPGLLEPRLQRSIETQNHEPRFAWNRLDPVALLACRGLRSEPDVHRTIGVDLQILVLAAHARILLVCLQHRTGLGVI